MNKACKIAAILLLLSSWSVARNAVPKLTRVKAEADTVRKSVEITYDLADAEQNPVEIRFKASFDGGRSFLISTANATGDVGFPVAPGSGRKITWRYPAYIHNIRDYEFRLVADDRQPFDVQALVDQLDSNQVRHLVTTICGERSRKTKAGLENLGKVKSLVNTRFKARGLMPYRQEYIHGDYRGHNFIGKLRGYGDETQTYVIGAHYDTVEDTPGADDNASGVAGMLTLMQLLGQYDFDRSINFVAFDLEEEGMVGSEEYVNWGGISDYERIAGFINLDMIGYYDARPNTQQLPEGFDQLFPEAYKAVADNGFRADFVVSIANEASRHLSEKFAANAARYVPGLKVVSLVVPGQGESLPTVTRSDHASFWNKKHPALFLGDGADTRNVNYETPTDTLDTLNFGQISNVLKAALATMCELAGIKHSTSVSVKTNAPTYE
jgi:hypothetical protein